MSAFMVSRRHIDALVTLLDLHKCSGLHPGQLPQDDPCLTLNDLMGRRLIGENRASINARYPDTIDHPDKEPGSGDADPNEYLYKVPFPVPTLVQGLKLIASYEYQACEHEGWKESWACRSMSHLRATLVSKLPGYYDAPWEV